MHVHVKYIIPIFFLPEHIPTYHEIPFTFITPRQEHERIDDDDDDDDDVYVGARGARCVYIYIGR